MDSRSFNEAAWNQLELPVTGRALGRELKVGQNLGKEFVLESLEMVGCRGQRDRNGKT